MKKLLSLVMAGMTLLVSVNDATAASSVMVVEGPQSPFYAFHFNVGSFDLYLPHDSQYGFDLELVNDGNTPWYTDGINSAPLRLATVRPHDQEISIFYDYNIDSNWVTPNRIRATTSAEIQPQQSTKFQFSIKAPNVSGKYLLALAPVIEGVTFLPGDPLLVNVIIDDIHTPSEQYQQATQKQIVINRKTQTMHQQVGGDDINAFVVSTGKSNTPTPAGMYRVYNKQDVRYSAAFNLYMDNWMGLTSDRYGFVGYGIHKLPYWKTKKGRLYEGEAHLGIPVSHGCIRLGYEESKIMFDWAEVGTLVRVI